MTQPPATTKDRQRALFLKTAAYLPELDAKLRAEKEAEKTAHRLAAIRIEAERQPRIEARCKRLIENLEKENNQWQRKLVIKALQI